MAADRGGPLWFAGRDATGVDEGAACARCRSITLSLELTPALRAVTRVTLAVEHSRCAVRGVQAKIAAVTAAFDVVVLSDVVAAITRLVKRTATVDPLRCRALPRSRRRRRRAITKAAAVGPDHRDRADICELVRSKWEYTAVDEQDSTFRSNLPRQRAVLRAVQVHVLRRLRQCTIKEPCLSTMYGINHTP